jgi:hypothetical protein
LVSKFSPDGTADHVCWVHEDDDAFDDALREFIAGGLARGDRLLCVGDVVVDRLRGDGLAALLASGTVETLTLAEAYEAAQQFTPENQPAYYAAATRRAVDDGYRGLRVIADVSALATDPAGRADLVRWEVEADEIMARGDGFSAMCTYSAGLPAGALAVAVAAHPAVHAPEALTPFRLCYDEGRLVLAGSVDTAGAARLAAVLASSPIGPTGGILDVSLLDFVDVAGCRALGRWVREERTSPVTVHGASPLFRRMWRLMGFDDAAPGALAGSPT